SLYEDFIAGGAAAELYCSRLLRTHCPRRLPECNPISPEDAMLKALVSACTVAACLVVFPSQSVAQQMIHALTGTVTSIDKTTKIITVLQDNGNTGFFVQMSNPKTRISFDRKVESAS